METLLNLITKQVYIIHPEADKKELEKTIKAIEKIIIENKPEKGNKYVVDIRVHHNKLEIDYYEDTPEDYSCWKKYISMEIGEVEEKIKTLLS